MKVMYGTVEEWNKRPLEDALRKQLAIAVEAMEKVRTLQPFCEIGRVIDDALAEIEQIETGSQDKPDNGA